jgi:hypothetical protein
MEDSMQNVIDVHEWKVRTVGSLMREAVEALQRFARRQDEKIAELKNLLARTESLRRKDFDRVMAEIQARRRESEESFACVLDVYLKEQEELTAWLRKIIADGSVTAEEFSLLAENILAEQKKKEKHLSTLLRELHLEHEEIWAMLGRLLARQERVRLKDFGMSVEAIRLRQQGRQGEVGRILDELWEVDDRVTSQWRRVLGSAAS